MEPSAEEPFFIICLKKTEYSPRLAIPGIVFVPCGKCGTEVVVAPSGVKIMKEQAAIPICNDCVPPEVCNVPIIVQLTEDQVREIRDSINILRSQRNN